MLHEPGAPHLLTVRGLRAPRTPCTRIHPPFHCRNRRAMVTMETHIPAEPTAHVDTFARDHLPPRELWPVRDWSGVPAEKLRVIANAVVYAAAAVVCCAAVTELLALCWASHAR